MTYRDFCCLGSKRKQGGIAGYNPRPCLSIFGRQGRGFFVDQMKENKLTLAEFEQDQSVVEALNETCRKRAGLVVGKDIPNFVRGQNIFLGVGLIFSGEISQGLGIGFVNMAVVARTIQKELSKSGKPPKIIALIADQHALAQTTDGQKKQIELTAEAVAVIVPKVFSFLGCPDDSVQIIKASDNNWNQALTTDYSEMESEDIAHAHGELGCAVKVGWETKRRRINGNPIHDEKWFDEFARQQKPLELTSMAFIRAPEWLSLKTYSGGENLALPPYFSDNSNFSLGKNLQFNQIGFTKQMSTQITRTESELKKIVDIPIKEKGVPNLQALANFCCLD